VRSPEPARGPHAANGLCSERRRSLFVQDLFRVGNCHCPSAGPPLPAIAVFGRVVMKCHTRSCANVH
jgi:hypothetical protein